MTPSEQKLMMYQESEMDKEAQLLTALALGGGAAIGKGVYNYFTRGRRAAQAVGQLQRKSVNELPTTMAGRNLMTASGANPQGFWAGLANKVNPKAQIREGDAAAALVAQMQTHGVDAVRKTLMKPTQIQGGTINGMSQAQADQVIAFAQMRVNDQVKGRIAQGAMNRGGAKNMSDEYVSALEAYNPYAAAALNAQQARDAARTAAKARNTAKTAKTAHQQALETARKDAETAHTAAVGAYDTEMKKVIGDIDALKTKGLANGSRGLAPFEQQIYNDALLRRKALEAAPPSFDKYHQDILKQRGLAAPLKAPAAPAAPAAAAGTPAAPAAPTTPPDFMESLKGGWNNLRMGKMPEGHQFLPLAMTAYAGDTVIDKFKS